MTRQEIVIVIFIIILLIGNVFWGGRYLSMSKQLQSVKKTIELQKVNEKVIKFGKLFINGVLRSENEVSFETRLMLENAVRDTGKKDIMSNWQKFIDSKSESEAQQNVKDLLESILNNIQTK